MSGCPGDVNGVMTAGEVEEPGVLGPWKDVRGASCVCAGWMVVVTAWTGGETAWAS